MSRRAASTLAWSLWALSVLLAVGGLVFYALTHSVELTGGGSRVSEQVFSLSFLACSTVGALIVSGRPGNRIGWLFLVAGLSWPVRNFCAGYATYALQQAPGSLPGGDVMAWVQAWFWVPGLTLITSFLPLLFPSGRFLSRRWRAVAWLAGLSALMMTAGLALPPGPINEFDFVDNPVGIAGAAFLLDWNFGWFLFPLSVILSAISMVVRFRRARGDERQQLKWFAAAAALLAVSLVATFFASNTEPAATLTEVLLGLAIGGVPIAAGIAIFKHGLYEIDLIIRRTLVYAVLSAILAGLYFGIVLGLQQAFGPLTRGNDLAIAGSTLAVAALFRPVRSRIQTTVDRRFYRRRYDAARTLEAFSARLRDQVDLEALGVELRSVVQETMQPAHASLWLRPPFEAATPAVTISGRSPSTREVR